MKLKRITCLLLVFLCLAGTTEAKKVAKKKEKANFKLLEAYSQKIVPGIPGAQPKTNFKFIIVWQGAKYPETFFWRGDGGWLTCSILKAHKIKNKGKSNPAGVEYNTEFAGGDNIHTGDTLQLTPTPGGKFPIPTEIPADAKNTLYYKTGGSGWLSFPVKYITKKPDVIMQ